MTTSKGYASDFIPSGFWAVLKKVSRPILKPALTLWFVLRNSGTPDWAKATIIGALGYLVCPLDAIPDFLPVVGYADDLAALLAVLKTVSEYVTDDVRSNVNRIIGD